MKQFAQRYRAARGYLSSKNARSDSYAPDEEEPSSHIRIDQADFDSDVEEVSYRPTECVGPEAETQEYSEKEENALILYHLLKRICPSLCDLEFDIQPKRRIGKTCTVAETGEFQELRGRLDAIEQSMHTLHDSCKSFAESQSTFLEEHKAFVDSLWPFVDNSDSTEEPFAPSNTETLTNRFAVGGSTPAPPRFEGGSGGEMSEDSCQSSGFDGGLCGATNATPRLVLTSEPENFQTVCNKLINLYNTDLTQQQHAHALFVKRVEAVLFGCITNEIATARIIQKDFEKSKTKLNDALTKLYNLTYKLMKKSATEELSFSGKVQYLYSKKSQGSKFESLKEEVADCGANFMNIMRHFKDITQIIQDKLDQEVAFHMAQFVEKESERQRGWARAPATC